jgi:hypothetical protein
VDPEFEASLGYRERERERYQSNKRNEGSQAGDTII